MCCRRLYPEHEKKIIKKINKKNKNRKRNRKFLNMLIRRPLQLRLTYLLLNTYVLGYFDKNEMLFCFNTKIIRCNNSTIITSFSIETPKIIIFSCVRFLNIQYI